MRKSLLILFCMLLMSGMVFAQSEEEPPALLDMLSFVPDTPETRLASLFYTNYDGWLEVIAERTPLSDAEALLECLRQAECEHLQAVSASQPALSFQGLQLRTLLANRVFPEAECERDPATFSMKCNTPPVIEALPEVMGFSLFDITHSLELRSFTLPSLVVVRGNFDMEAVNTAFTGRGYTAEEAPQDVTLWCGPEGCDGSIAGQDTIDTANIFGGHIGAMPNVAAISNHLLTSSGGSAVNILLATHTHGQPSLSDSADIQALVEALDTIPGTLIQAAVNPSSAGISLNLESAILDAASSGEVPSSEELLEPFTRWQEFPVPPYSALAVADYLTAEGRQTVVALAFDDADTAALAAENIPQLMEVYTSSSFQLPVLELIAVRGGSMQTEIYTQEGAVGKSVLLLTWLATPPDAGSEDESAYLAGGVFPLMLRFLLDNDLGWLAAGVILPE